MDTASGEAALRVWPPLLVTKGRGAASSMHAHHAMHLVIALTGTLRVRSADGRVEQAEGVLSGPDVAHALDAAGVEVVLLFVDPESDAGERLRSDLPGLRFITPSERSAILEDLPMTASPGEQFAWAERAIHRFSGALAPRRMDPRVRRLLLRLRAMPPDADTSLPALSAIAGLSESRLLHVFRASVGIPIRPYLLWLKLQRSIGALAQGASLTEAAHDAGFSDAAHMSRTFRRMFGMTASALKRTLEDRGE